MQPLAAGWLVLALLGLQVFFCAVVFPGARAGAHIAALGGEIASSCGRLTASQAAAMQGLQHKMREAGKVSATLLVVAVPEMGVAR